MEEPRAQGQLHEEGQPIQEVGQAGRQDAEHADGGAGKQTVEASGHAAESMREDREFVLETVKQKVGDASQFAGVSLRELREQLIAERIEDSEMGPCCLCGVGVPDAESADEDEPVACVECHAVAHETCLGTSRQS